MFFRNACEHQWKNQWGSTVCSKCGNSQRYLEGVSPRATKLNDAEAKYGPFGVGRGLIELARGQYGLGFFAVLDSEGKWIAAEIGAACYYPLRELRGTVSYNDDDEEVYTPRAGVNATYIIDWPFSGNIDREGDDWVEKVWKKVGGETGWASKYFTWFANESPWHPVFVTKDWTKAFNEGVVYDARHSSEIVLSAMIAIRQIGEFPNVPKMWNAAMKHTDNGMLAFMAAHYGEVDRGNVTSKEHVSGHAAFYTAYFNPNMQMRNFLEGRLVLPDANLRMPMNERWNWGPCVQIFGPGAYTGYGSEKMHHINPPVTEAQRKRDMFGQAYLEGGTKTLEAWMDEFTEECYKWELRNPKS